MKLYTFDPAPNPRRLALLMKVKGIDIETEQVPLDGTQFSDQYRAINPNCTVPALVLDNGTVLDQVIAQCVYLDAEHPAPPLFGSDNLERAQVFGWYNRIMLEAFMPIADVLRNQGKRFENRPLPGLVDMPQIPELVERGNLRLPPFFKVVNAHLEGRQFMVGDRLSMADIDLFVTVEFAGWIKFSVDPELSHFHRWYEGVTPQLAG